MGHRNKYIGKFVETEFEPINEPFSIASLRHLLISALSSSLYTHQQIADWAGRFSHECLEGKLSEHENDKISKAADIAQDVNAQWDMFLYNTYSLEQLQNMDFSQVKLPADWFKEWHAELD